MARRTSPDLTRCAVPILRIDHPAGRAVVLDIAFHRAVVLDLVEPLAPVQARRLADARIALEVVRLDAQMAH